MSSKLHFKHGDIAALPTLLPGEPAYSVDVKKLHIGSIAHTTTFMNKDQLQAQLQKAEKQNKAAVQQFIDDFEQLLQVDDKPQQAFFQTDTLDSASEQLISAFNELPFTTDEAHLLLEAGTLSDFLTAQADWHAYDAAIETKITALKQAIQPLMALALER